LSAATQDAERDAARRREDAGYTALWFGEGPATREPFAQAALVLSWTQRVVVATGIASILCG
jgi:alkanesulfonate monooxygenase SsuD/methylene tetrahydromethanopterin reductase-like flavin-dependent oxidoreductase (luciferase family)